jgi:hypothetical protein
MGKKEQNPIDTNDDALSPNEANQRRDETLRNMLRTKPKPHEEMKVGRTMRPRNPKRDSR